MPNTNSQYGSSKDIITEESPFNPLSHYAVTKCDAENYIMNSGNIVAHGNRSEILKKGDLMSSLTGVEN